MPRVVRALVKRIGVNLPTLLPGKKSSMRHWRVRA
jgi:uncharacterized cupin superfamily protein